MARTSLDLRKRIVDAYLSGRTKTYNETAAMFGVGRATVNRLLRRKRDSGDVLPLPVGGNNPRRVELAWLDAHARAHPDARIVDRIAAWKEHTGKKVSLGAMWGALHALGWTHKKSRWSPGKESGRTSRKGVNASSKNSRSSKPRV